MKKYLSALVLSGLIYGPAQAAVTGSLVFTDPTGTVNATDSIEVWVTLTLDQTSDSLTYDPDISFPNGINMADIPTGGYDGQGAYVLFESYNYVYQFTGRPCNDTFTVSCSDPGSQYGPAYVSSPSKWLSFTGTINPGESMDFLWGAWAPVDGTAAPGTYELYTAYIGLGVGGLDADGNNLDADIYLFSTDCSAANCTFSRTVSAVPVPAAVWLFGSGLLGLIGVARRKKAA